MISTIEKALDKRHHQSAVINVCDIDFAQHVVEACKLNHCGRYNKSWSCPPAVGELSQLKEKYSAYKYAYIFTTKTDLEDCFDIETMEIARVNHTKITDDVIAAIKAKNKQFGVLGAGSCCICKQCTYPTAPCRFPDRVYPSIEACGIDVVQLSRTCNINYINGQNTVTYFSAIFFSENSRLV